MKKLLTLILALYASAASAQNLPIGSIPVGKGPGVIGWGVLGPCPAGQTISWGATDPVCIAGPVTPASFGAVCDGVADDTTALRNMFATGPATFDFDPKKTCLISGSLQPPSGSVIRGNGGTLKAVAAGWDVSGDGSNYGMITLKDKNDVRISGLHFFGTKTQDITHTPKFIAGFTTNRIWIEDNYFENSAFEGIWPNSPTANSYWYIRNNTFNNVGYPAGAFGSLPAIQAQFNNSVVDGNILLDVGMGIGMNGANNVVSNNVVNGLRYYGIAVNSDAAFPRKAVVANNKIQFSPQGAFANTGILVGNADDTVEPDPVIVIGNQIEITTSDTVNFSNGIRVLGRNTNHVNVTGNSVEVTGIGKAVAYGFFGETGSATTFDIKNNVAFFSSNTGSDVQTGFLAVPNGGTTNILISNNSVIGLEVGRNNPAYDFTTLSGGTTPVFFYENNLKTAGFIRAPSAATLAADGADNNRPYSYNTTRRVSGYMDETWLAPNGSADAPSISFVNSPLSGTGKPGTGFYLSSAGGGQWAAVTQDLPNFAVGFNFLRLNSGATFGWAAGDPTSTGFDLFLKRGAAATLQYGDTDAAAPVAQTTQVQSVVAGTADTAGVNWTLNASRGTGTGAGGNIIVQTAPAGGAGSAQNALIQTSVFDSKGHIRVGNDTAPALTSCGTDPSIIGTDEAGEVTMGTGTPTGCIITFNRAYVSAPLCVLNWQATPLASQSWTVSNTAITTVQTATSSNKLNYICRARNGG